MDTTYLVYCFNCAQKYEQGKGRGEDELRQPTGCGLCGSEMIGTYLKTVPYPGWASTPAPGSLTRNGNPQ